MIKTFEFYFDFACPYSFLAHKQIRNIENENSIQVKYKPILLGGLLKSAGIKAIEDVPVKGKHMIKDCKLWAEKYNINFKFNSYFPIINLNLMRCSLLAEKKDFLQNFTNKIFDAIWKDGLNLNDKTIFEKLLKNMDVNAIKFLADAMDEKIKKDLKNRTDNAFAKGIFGTPSFAINNKIFWGQDRLEFVLLEAKK